MKNKKQIVDEKKYIDCEEFTKELIEASRTPFKWFDPSNGGLLILAIVFFPITILCALWILGNWDGKIKGFKIM
jgi:hypothetical protein